jgi:hemerythrin superfamily protein
MTDRIDAIELLLEDHRMIGGLAAQLDDTDDPAEIWRLYQRIVDELFAHEAAEHEVVFPAFRSSLEGSGDRTVADRMGEHEEMNELLAEMRNLTPDAFAFVKRGSAFLLQVVGHFQREEESVFARMRASIAGDELVELGRRALAVKRRFLAISDDEPLLDPDGSHRSQIRT